MTTENGYVPFETTAKILARGDDSIRDFMLSVFPEATPSQLEKCVYFAAGLIHDGMEFGVGISDWEAVDAIEAYQQGAEDQVTRHITAGISNLEAYKMGFEDGKPKGGR